ncbi:MAG: PAS domain S-box protein [Lautropia sp.]
MGGTAGSRRLIDPDAWRAWRYLGIAHLGGMALFLGLMGAFLWYVEHLERHERKQALYRDIEWAQQSLRLHWAEARDHLAAEGPVLVAAAGAGVIDQSSPRDFFARDPQALYMAFAVPSRRVQWASAAWGTSLPRDREGGVRFEDSAGYFAFNQALSSLRPQFSTPFVVPGNEVVIELHVPVLKDQAVLGVLVTGFSLMRSLQNGVPESIRSRYLMNIVDAGGNTLVSTSTRRLLDAKLSYGLPLEPPGHGIRLQAVALDEGRSLAQRLTLAGLIGASLAAIITLALLWRSARARLRLEAERDRLFMFSQDVLCVLETDGTVVRGNPAFEDYLGPPLPNARLFDRIHPDDRPAVDRAFSKPFERIPTLEFRVKQRNVWRWLSWSFSVDRGDDGRTRLYAAAHDITGRKQTEHALAAETAFRRAMEDSISTGMRVIDQDGRITYVNPAFCRMVGFDEEELVGTYPPYPYWAEEDFELNHRWIRQTVGGEAPDTGIQSRVRRKDGRLLDVRMYVSPLIDDHGEQAGWMTSVTDITEPNRIRAELAAAHERFTTVLDELGASVSVSPLASPVPSLAAVAAADPGRDQAAPGLGLLFANRQYRTLFGSTPLGHQALVAGKPAGDDWVEQEVYVARIERWFEVRARNIRWVDGQPVQLVVANDISAQHEAREAQDQQVEQLQQTSRLVTMGEMASSIAHELNQPLAAISNYTLGLASRLKRQRGESGLPPEVIETLDKTARQAQRAAAVIRRIREFVKRSEPERRRIAVQAVVADALGLAEIAAKRQQVSIHTRIDRHLPDLDADPILIEQVLINLLKNGVEAMRQQPRRELVLSVLARDGQIEFAVADLGPGLSAEMQGRLFEPFFTTKAEGMGIGLNICRSIVESHGGRLWVEPNQPSGCVFRFVLPAAAPSAVAA